jgi:organic hydroperoxide reductase OsmC/OhrA
MVDFDNGRGGRVSGLHEFQMTTEWTGNLGSGTSAYRSYRRDHEISGPGKTSTILGSSAPAFLGTGARYNPEELLIASLSSCHMLWLLHLCADAGIIVTDYTDAAVGTMAVHPDGSGEFTRVVLHPRMTITDASRVEEAKALHAKAHALCFIARSVRFPVEHEAEVVASK